jgi:K+ transporter
VRFADIPRVSLADRLELIRVFEGFWHLTVHDGFVEILDLPSTLRAAEDLGCPVDLDSAVYFGASENTTKSCVARRVVGSCGGVGHFIARIKGALLAAEISCGE